LFEALENLEEIQAGVLEQIVCFEDLLEILATTSQKVSVIRIGYPWQANYTIPLGEFDSTNFVPRGDHNNVVQNLSRLFDRYPSPLGEGVVLVPLLKIHH